MAKFEKHVRGDFMMITKQLREDIFSKGLSMNLVDESYYQNENIKVSILVFDKYFMRNSSRASLSVTVIGSADEIFISAIGAGGGNGAIFNFSWGTESNLTRVVEKSLNRMGY